jgi:hypothetical protein
VSEEVASFSRAVVATCQPNSPARAKSLLFATSKLGAFAQARGLSLDPAVVLHPSVIERFIVEGERTLTGATRRTLRSNLRFVAARVVPMLGAGPVPLARERAKAPYSPGEIDGYLALAAAQATEARCRRATGLICLGAGAGLVGGDLRAVHGDDVSMCSGGVVVEVGGRCPRTVPVLGQFCEPLLGAARFADSGFIVGGVDPTRRNVTDRLVASLAGGTGLARLEVSRLRSSWLRACAEAIGLRAFMDAAGITCSQRLGDIVATLAPLRVEDAVAVLGGRC